MDRTLEARLLALPHLSRENAAAASIPCKICRQPAPFFDIVDFQKCVGSYAFGPSGIHIAWHRCNHCGFLFTPFFDDWSLVDFARYIYNDDYAVVDPDYVSLRPRTMARTLAALFAGCEAARILDYGAGQGLLAESLAEFGFQHVESYDPFSLPVRPSGTFDIITCNEVIEHAPFPLRAIEDMRSLLRDEGCIVFSETLQPADIGRVRCGWWYVAPRNGHVSTFTDRTLAFIAAEFGLIFHRGGGSIHAMRTGHDGVYAEIASRCGPSFASWHLGAPGGGPADGWSGVEDRPPTQFRWTTSNTLYWSIDVPNWRPHCLQVTVPFTHESRHGFASDCHIEVNDRAAATHVRDKIIHAEIGPVNVGPARVILRTPGLTRSGEREIGLAVLVI